MSLFKLISLNTSLGQDLARLNVKNSRNKRQKLSKKTSKLAEKLSKIAKVSVESCRENVKNSQKKLEKCSGTLPGVSGEVCNNFVHKLKVFTFYENSFLWIRSVSRILTMKLFIFTLVFS